MKRRRWATKRGYAGTAAALGYPRAFRNIAEFVVFFAFVGSIHALLDRVIGRFSCAT
ncbi:MAG: hypothetical protein NUV72_03310 [Bauldia sp.]|nr:hypothetical protein [Bauldia sp.]